MKNFQKIKHKNDLNGVFVPAIIHNHNYHFVDLSVYENGRVDDWNFKDWEHFRNDVKKGWLVCQIPDNESISIFHLGGWRIKNAHWEFDEQSFIRHIENQIKTMNPNWKNIYEYSPKFENGIEIGELGRGTPYKVGIDNQFIEGKSFNLFLKKENGYFLVQVIVFKDSTIRISRIENPFEISLLEFETMIQNDKILSKIPQNSQVQIYALGRFGVTKEIWAEEIKNILQEIKETIKKMNGEQTFFEICQETLSHYKKNPTAENKEKLKTAYENVPEHLRMYLGDMDSKDAEYRQIIYGK